MTQHILGWRPDTPDNRDRCFPHAKVLRRLKTLPASVDLRPKMPPVYDQGQLGSCTANAIGAAFQYQQIKQALESYTPSRLFIYYGEREIERTIASDAGAEIRDGMKVIAKLGAPHEALWPYKIGQFATKPPAKAYTDALQHNCIAYERVAVSVTAVKTALASGRPVVFGFTVYDSFYDTNPIMPIPKAGEAVAGGHAVLAVGYKTIKGTEYAIVRNSWGASWAEGGYFYMPLAWMCNTANADDFWSIDITEGA